MRMGRSLWIALIAGAVGAGVCSCGVLAPRACAGPAEGPPGIQLDATPWLAAHPGASLEACLASRCATLSRDQETAELQTTMQDVEGTYPLTLRSGGTVVAEEQIHLADPAVAGPCGTVHVLAIKPLTLNGSGELLDTPPHPAPYASASSSP